MKKILLIIITLFVFIVLSQRNNFSNIFNSDLSIRVNSLTINNIQFIINYTTPQFYTASASSDSIAGALVPSQAYFNPRPLLFLVDTSNISGVDAVVKATTLNSYNKFTKMKLSSLLNNPTASPTLITTSPAVGSFVSGAAGDALASDVKNLISVVNLQNPSNINVSITPNSGVKNTAVSCTIAPSADIVTTPLVVQRTYALGISVMNGVDLPTTSVASVWHGVKSDGQAAGITTKYSPFTWVGFTINDNSINLSDNNSRPISPAIINISYSQLNVVN